MNFQGSLQPAAIERNEVSILSQRPAAPPPQTARRFGGGDQPSHVNGNPMGGDELSAMNSFNTNMGYGDSINREERYA